MAMMCMDEERAVDRTDYRIVRGCLGISYIVYSIRDPIGDRVGVVSTFDEAEALIASDLLMARARSEQWRAEGNAWM